MENNFIDAYTRKQAISDGVLIDVTNIAKETGFKIPVAITQNVDAIIKEATKSGLADFEGVLWDIFSVLLDRIRTGDRKASSITFEVSIFRPSADCNCLITFTSVVLPGDNYEPVITIQVPEED